MAVTPTPAPVAVSDPTVRARGAAARRRLPRLVVAAAVAVALIAAIVRVAPGGVPAVVVRWKTTALEQLAAKAVVMAMRATPAIARAEAREPDVTRADARIRREGHESIPGGILFVPSTFASADGTYDLYLHFHGNTRVVLESAEVAGVNAIVAIVNLGVGSAPYEDAYAVPGTYEALLDDIQRAVLKRRLTGAHLGRVALGSWSAGYGAIGTILDLRRGTDRLDAVLVTDGIHCGWLDDNHAELNYRQLAPWVRAAQKAAAGQMLFAITHSQVEPIGYASARDTATFLLDSVGGKRGEPEVTELPHLALRSAEGAVAKKLEKRMEPVEEARVGGFHVRGFRGNTPEHHMAHLLQMGATVMPELAQYWRGSR